MVAKTMVGARATISIDTVTIGMFDSCDYSVSIGTEPIFTLGKYSAQEIVPTSYEIVTVNCSGFRVIGDNANKNIKAPDLSKLLRQEGITISIVDRQTGKNILSVNNCVATSYGTGYSAKSTSRIRVTYQGTTADDETNGPQGDGTATNFPS